MIEAVAGSRAWRKVGALFVRALGELVQTPFAAVPEPPSSRAPVFVADVSLSRPDVELHLSIVIEPASMSRMAKRLLDSDDVADAESLVLEAANVLMGTFRTSLAAEGLCLVLGLPEVGSADRSRRRLDGAPLRARMAAASLAGELEIWLAVIPADARRDV
ncbi:MAG: hypothetical protein KF850_41850 [Labilithrix sp.]|nr:hypothetical protein [Labilithrix sp.]